MNILSNLQEIANIIIRPSRYTYKITDLGNRTFKINDKQVFRQDLQIKNPRNLKIKASVYSTRQLKEAAHVMIYLHCNSGCRIQGLAYLKLAIEHDFSYVVFDFTGSGMSEGKYVSLGFYETIDLQCVFSHLKSITNPQAKFVLWGRSMGAVTALNFLLKKKHQVFLAVFDSPFRSLKQLFVQIGRQKTSFPDFILQMAYNYLKPIILQKAQFDIQEVGLKLENNSIYTPGIFVASKQDTLVPFQQIEEIFNLYKGEKEMLFIQQGHNEARNFKVIGGIFNSIKKQLMATQAKEKLQLERQLDKKNHLMSLGGQKLDKKQLSRKKLELTIKSLSQRHLFTTTIGKILKDEDLLQQRRPKISQTRMNIKLILEEHKQDQRKQQKLDQQQINQLIGTTPHLEKKPISCLLPHKKPLKVLSIEEEENRLSFQQSDKKILMNNKSESKLNIKRKPFQIKNFFGQNTTHSKQKDYIKIQESGKKEHKFIPPKTEALRQKKSENTYARHQATIKDPLKNLSGIYSSKQFPANMSPYKQSQQTQLSHKRPKLQLGQSSHKKPKQKQQPHSDIKNENHKLNCHEDFVKQKQFLRRCQSLQKIFKVQQSSQPSEHQGSQPPATQTYRQIKCTQRVLQKIIQKQQRKLLILNLQSIENRKQKQHREVVQEVRERKTLQYVVNKKPPFVQLKGIRNFRNSLETKYKTEMRK